MSTSQCIGNHRTARTDIDCPLVLLRHVWRPSVKEGPKRQLPSLQLRDLFSAQTRTTTPTMTIGFDRPSGAAADVKELEYVSAIHQTDLKELRKDGSITGEQAKEIWVNLAARAECESYCAVSSLFHTRR